MKKSPWFKIFLGIVAIVGLTCLPLPVFAQHGGHGGGGGFRGGGGGFHGSVGAYHGGGGYSGYGGRGYYGGHYGGHYGGRYYGGRGGYYGWRGGYWGYPRYGYGYGWGYGWGIGLGFGWPYWWGYPYAYSYSPGVSAPYSYDYNYPYSCPPGYSCISNGNDDPPPANPGPQPESEPAKPWGPGAPQGAANKNYTDKGVTTSEQGAMILAVDRRTAAPSDYRVAQPASLKYLPLSPELEKAMRSLREMPPFAREREIETGRYSHFSPQEKQILRTVH